MFSITIIGSMINGGYDDVVVGQADYFVYYLESILSNLQFVLRFFDYGGLLYLHCIFSISIFPMGYSILQW